MAARATFHSCQLSIYNCNDVVIACNRVSSEWEQLAVYLGIDRPTVEGIILKEGGGGKTAGCLIKLIAVWLRQPSPTQPKPTWKILCDAVSNIDRPLSEEIWTDHTSGCSLCLMQKTEHKQMTPEQIIGQPAAACTVTTVTDRLQDSFIAYHSNILVGDKVVIWGGHKPDTILATLDNPHSKKRQFTSSITIYNILQSSLDTRLTTGTPPNGIIGYSSCYIGEDIYYFGGCCKGDYYHNNLFILNTKSHEWREINCDDGPMKKAGCGMIFFSINGEDYLLVIGGHGPVPAHDTPDHYKYTTHPNKPSMCYTNEVHIMCVSSTPGKWTVPMMTDGSVFPPLAGFSINTLPDNNRAIVFGGASVDHEEIVHTNDVFILTYSAVNNSLNIQEVVKPSDLSIQWPVRRVFHSSVVITSVSSNGERKHHLLVMGGKGTDNDVIPDCYTMSINENIKWKKISQLRVVVSGRWGHSMTCFKMSMYCVWLIITGGLEINEPHPKRLTMIELVFSPSDDNWSVSVIMNEKDMKNKAQYTKLVSDRLTVREKEYQLMMESTVPATTEPGLTGGGEEQVELLKQQLKLKDKESRKTLKKMNKKLKKKDLMILDREETIRNNKQEFLHDTIHQKNEEIRQKDERLQQKQLEISNLQSQLESCPWEIQDEEVHVSDAIIGGGAYGEVRVAEFRGTKVAAKLIHELIVSRHNKAIFIREMEISSRIHHPNIVQFIGATRINNPILLYELMATSLHKRLQDDESLTHSQIVNIASDICTAMCYLHQWRPDPIIHRDISTPNVLMEPLRNDKWRAKLSDFGSANLQLHIKTVIPGNPAYAAPEAVIPQHHSPAMDVYSFGVLLTEMTLHRAPEMDSTRHQQSAHSIDRVEMRVIVLKCINDDRSQRLSSKLLLTELRKL